MNPDPHSTASSMVPPELKIPPPRRPRMARGGYIMILLAVGFLAFCIGLGFRGWADAIRGIRYRATSGRGTGEATGVIVKWKSKLATVQYSFNVGWEAFTGQARVPVQLLRGFHERTSLPINYVLADPTTNYPADWEWSPILDWEALLFLSIMILPGYMLLTMRLERMLLTAGTPTIAVVSKCSTGGRGGIYLKYEFRTQDGTLINGNSESETRQEVGALIPVLYMPQKPKRNLPYPPSFHRLPDA